MRAKLELKQFHEPVAGINLLKFEVGGGKFAAIAAYDRGFADGVESAVRQAAAEKAEFAALVVESLGEINLTATEARFRVLSIIRPALEAILDAVCPDLALHALKSEILREAALVLEDDIRRPINVLVAPQNAEMLTRSLAKQHLGLEIQSDPDLAAHQVELDWGTGHVVINLTDCIDRCRSIVSNYFADQGKASVDDQ